jgi:hypothetical protein
LAIVVPCSIAKIPLRNRFLNGDSVMNKNIFLAVITALSAIIVSCGGGNGATDAPLAGRKGKLAADQNLIVNGSFEGNHCSMAVPPDNIFDPLNYTSHRFELKNDEVAGWFIPYDPSNTQSVECFKNINYSVNLTFTKIGPTPYGNQWLVLGGILSFPHIISSSIQQTITGLTPGIVYKLSFAISGDVDCCSVAEVSFLSGSSTPSRTFSAPAAGSVLVLPTMLYKVWATKKIIFTPTSDTVTLQIKNTGILHSLGLDNVIVEAYVPSDDSIPDPCEQSSASTILCENQVLLESIPLIGTPFSLNYSSERVPAREAAIPIVVDHSKQIGGWTLGDHHTYDTLSNRLYLGDGRWRDGVALGNIELRANGTYVIASEDGGSAEHEH